MNLLTDKVKTLYFKYLAAAFGSSFISSVYGLADTAMVGQYQGPEGTAALAVVAPVWNIIYSLGLLTGIGGSVLFGIARGKKTEKNENEFFSAALWSTVFLSLLCWLVIGFFDKEMLLLFGADETLIPLSRSYLLPVKFTVPVFLFNQMLAAFLRNDNAPELATKAVLAGGIFNVAGDYFFVFTMDLGIFGAGLATAMGACITLLMMLSHFFSKKNTLKLVPCSHIFRKAKALVLMGFSTFFIDAAMGILTIFFNRQIMKYLGTDALSVYGILVNISTFVQCCAYSVGQAAQPIISINFGAQNGNRIREVLKYSLYAAGCFSAVWLFLTLSFPNGFVRIFMKPTKEVLEIAPNIIRSYCISFLLLPLNIFSTYYFQSLLKPAASFCISVLRGMVISGLLIYLLPVVCSPAALWFAMPLTELVVAAGVVMLMIRYTRQLPQQ